MTLKRTRHKFLSNSPYSSVPPEDRKEVLVRPVYLLLGLYPVNRELIDLRILVGDAFYRMYVIRGVNLMRRIQVSVSRCFYLKLRIFISKLFISEFLMFIPDALVYLNR